MRIRRKEMIFAAAVVMMTGGSAWAERARTGPVAPPENPRLRARVDVAMRVGIGVTAAGLMGLIGGLLYRERKQRLRGGGSS